MERNIELLIDDCVSDVLSGRASLQECLAKYPDERPELGPLLSLALSLAPPMKPDPERKAHARSRFLVELDKHGYPSSHGGRPWEFHSMRLGQYSKWSGDGY